MTGSDSRTQSAAHWSQISAHSLQRCLACSEFISMKCAAVRQISAQAVINGSHALDFKGVTLAREEAFLRVKRQTIRLFVKIRGLMKFGTN